MKSKYFIKGDPDYKFSKEIYQKQFNYVFPKNELHIHIKAVVRFNIMVGKDLLCIREKTYDEYGDITSYTYSYIIEFIDPTKTCSLFLFWNLLDIYIARYSKVNELFLEINKRIVTGARITIKSLLNRKIVVRDLCGNECEVLTIKNR